MDAHQVPSETPHSAEPKSAGDEGAAALAPETLPGSEPILGASRPDHPRVVIVGAGFGGLEAAKALARAPVEVVIVDQHNYHCFQPLLYQVATAALSPADIAWPIRAIVRSQRNARAVMARVVGIDKERKLVATDIGSFNYDFLVLATGATHSYFGHDEWESVAPGLKEIADAIKIRTRVLLAFERAELIEDEQERRRLMTFVVIGGGATGVEMAGAIAEVARQTLRSDFRRIDPRLARIVLVEAGPRLLATFPDHMSRYAVGSLTWMGVEVRTGARVTACDAHGVSIGNERIEASTLIWAAGVIASPAAEWLGAAHDRNGRVLVNPDLSVGDIPNAFAIGDTAAVKDPSGDPVPGVAPAAKQMGRYVGERIAAELTGAPRPEPFAYRDLGELATIGRKSALVKLGRVQLTGFVGWLFWSIVHIYFLIGARDRLVVAVNWFWNYLTFQRGARLIT
jgi:NADH dehydrogenase